MYTSVTTLRQRGPIDSIESIDAPEGLSVDFDAVLSCTVDETRTDPSVGVDIVTRYRARLGDAEVIFERRSWRPGFGYCASGEEDRIIAG